jgi:hypothetical protein
VWRPCSPALSARCTASPVTPYPLPPPLRRSPVSCSLRSRRSRCAVSVVPEVNLSAVAQCACAVRCPRCCRSRYADDGCQHAVRSIVETSRAGAAEVHTFSCDRLVDDCHRRILGQLSSYSGEQWLWTMEAFRSGSLHSLRQPRDIWRIVQFNPSEALRDAARLSIFSSKRKQTKR